VPILVAAHEDRLRQRVTGISHRDAIDDELVNVVIDLLEQLARDGAAFTGAADAVVHWDLCWWVIKCQASKRAAWLEDAQRWCSPFGRQRTAYDGGIVGSSAMARRKSQEKRSRKRTRAKTRRAWEGWRSLGKAQKPDVPKRGRRDEENKLCTIINSNRTRFSDSSCNTTGRSEPMLGLRRHPIMELFPVAIRI
jgi:hypothetical protein